jgi:hypothetical protein
LGKISQVGRQSYQDGLLDADALTEQPCWQSYEPSRDGTYRKHRPNEVHLKTHFAQVKVQIEQYSPDSGTQALKDGGYEKEFGVAIERTQVMNVLSDSSGRLQSFFTEETRTINLPQINILARTVIDFRMRR